MCRNKNCFSCGKLGHFAPKVIYGQIHFHNAFVSNCLILIETVPFWIADLAAIDHIVQDRNAYVDFRRIRKGSRSIYIGNKKSLDVLGIGTYKFFDTKGPCSLSP